MIDLNKEIIFKDGITNDEGASEWAQRYLDDADYMRRLGQHFGLTLDKFEIRDELIYFEWRGTKRDVLNYYNYYALNMTTESIEEIRATDMIIFNK